VAGVRDPTPSPEVAVFSFLRRTTPEIGVDELEGLLDQGSARVLDVREDWEFRRGHLPGALHIPVKQLAGRIDELTRDARYAVICQSGSRSLAATDLLIVKGFDGATSVRGGTSAWARSGRPLE
jgi:rhodanese-related sulfurtransferase